MSKHQISTFIRLILGFRCRVSGVREIQRTACDKLSRVEDMGQTVFCLLTSVLCYLTPEH